MYLHWNGGRDTVEPLLCYYELKGYHTPNADSYKWAHMAQVMGNFIGGTCSVGIDFCTTDSRMDPGDNSTLLLDTIAASFEAARQDASWYRAKAI